MKNPREFANYKQALANRKVILLAECGSTLYGLQTSNNSDVDEMGIVLESPADLLGFEPFEDDTYRTATDRTGKYDAKSEPGDLDLVLYGLRKFVKLAIIGNPNIINMLYVPKDKCSVFSPIAVELQHMAPCFVSKRVLKSFAGYLKAQRLRLVGVRGGMRVNRADLVAENGYDTKYAMHMIRLGMQGVQFATAHQLMFPLPYDHTAYLQAVRNGDYALDAIIDKAEWYESNLTQYINLNDGLPDEPNYKAIEEWLMNTYRREWYENSQASQQQRTAADTPGQDPFAGQTYGEAIDAEIPF